MCAVAGPAGLTPASAIAADMAVKEAAAPPSPWDIAIAGALMSDYNFRGITQSNHQPSAQIGFEPRYNFTPALQGYVGVSGESIDFPNRAAAEIDLLRRIVRLSASSRSILVFGIIITRAASASIRRHFAGPALRLCPMETSSNRI